MYTFKVAYLIKKNRKCNEKLKHMPLNYAYFLLFLMV